MTIWKASCRTADDHHRRLAAGRTSHALVERLVRAESIERYLLDELDRHLSAKARRGNAAPC
ncbi:MAG: hypothetical protein R2911_32125 [Caldilineaceae bacterium]